MLTLELADRMVEGALKAARERKAMPIAVLVLDAGGHPVAFKREDRASLFRFDIARAKAMGALGMGADTRDLAGRAAVNPTFLITVAMATGGSLALSPGGVLIRDSAAGILGAMGISGDTGDVDEQCAISAIIGAGLSVSDGLRIA